MIIGRDRDTRLRDLGFRDRCLTVGWYSATHDTDADGERPRPIGQAGQIPAADVPTIAQWTTCANASVIKTVPPKRNAPPRSRSRAG